jgi:hypothetical protein
MDNPMKNFGNRKDSIGFLVSFAAWVFYSIVLIGLVRRSCGLDLQLWYLGIIEAAWLSCAIVFLFGCVSWRNQNDTVHKVSLVTKWECILSGGFLIHPCLGLLYFYFVKNLKI